MRRTLGYNRALDGLRAAAVGVVICDHAGLPAVGTYGVVVFFVISGYLITGLLLAEHGSTGTLSIRDFYRRRFARLAPALLLVVGVTVAWVIGIGLSVSNWIAGLVGALTYTTDFIEQTALQPHISTYFEWSWSLAIEEQFYLVWPVLMIVLLAFGGRWGRTWLASFAGAVVVLAWLSRADMAGVQSAQQSVSFAFRTHMDAIALGAILAIVTAGRVFGRLARHLAGTVAVLAFVTLGVLMDGSLKILPLYSGDARGYGQVALICLVIVAGLVIAPSGVLARFLGWRPFVHLGQLSYGLYLWNMLFMNGFNQLFGHKPTDAGWAGLLWLLALVGTAEASYRWVETPLRKRWAHRPEPAAQPAASGTSVAPRLVPAR
jgi:peptidoglycan/LPS O-acetylase OafA/YrhL